MLASLLSSCGLFAEQKPVQEPTHTWSNGERYDTLGDYEAMLGTTAYSQGNFEEAEKQINASLALNPKQTQALLVGALMYEQLGRPNRARQHYEDLIILGGEKTSLLGSTTGGPEKVTDIAKKRLRMITLRQSNLVVEDRDGNKVFQVSNAASQEHSMTAMEEALFRREQKLVMENKSSTDADRKAVEVLFSDEDKNIISRFLILKELAERDLITKEEFLDARTANIGGLLPLTHKPAAAGVEHPVPSAKVIIDRISDLKDALDARAITPREFSSERNLIVEAILPPTPRTRMKNKAPARDIMGAAKEMRKAEVLYDLNLITSKERDNEQAAIEKYLGINRGEPQEQKTAKAAPVAPAATTQKAAVNTAVADTINSVQEVPAQQADLIIKEHLIGEDTKPIDVAPELLIPNVSEPF
jgi:tetratricopeptide (TPR) repeat protein